MTRHKPPQKIGLGHCQSGMNIALCVLIAIFACTALSVLGCAKKKEETKAEKIINVKTMVIQKQQIRPFIEAVGTLKPNEEVIISPEVSGVIQKILVDEGDSVTNGMELARVNDTDYRLAMQSAEASFKQAEIALSNTKTEYLRKEVLFIQKIISQQEFDIVTMRLNLAQQDLERAKAGFALAKQQFSKTIIRSSLNGRVKEKMFTVGDFARATTPLMTIIQINPLKLAFAVSEKNVGSLKIGQDVIFTVDAFPDKEFKGRLKVIYPSLDERSRTLKAEALVQNPSLQLKPGLFARTKVYTEAEKKAVVIPITSILYEGTATRVFLMEGGRAKEKSIKTGIKYGDMIEVVEGLQGGEKLIIVGQNLLAEGIKVNVVK